jgi:hypothetical protein
MERTGRLVLPLILVHLVTLGPATADAVEPQSHMGIPHREVVMSRWRAPAAGRAAARPPAPVDPAPPATPVEPEATGPFGITATTRLPVAAGLVDIAVAGLDEDQRADIAVTANGSALLPAAPNLVMLLFDDGSRTFPGRVTLPLPGSPAGIAVADLDLDGDQDLAVCEVAAWYEWPDSVVVFENLGGRVFARAGAYSLASATQHAGSILGTRPTIADWSGDGLLDIAIASPSRGALSLFRGLGGTAFDSVLAVPLGPGAVSVAVGDVEGDGHPDAFVTFEGCNSMSRFRAHPTFGLEYIGEVGIRWDALHATLTEFTGDAGPDLLAVTTHGTLSVVENVAGSFPGWVDVPVLRFPTDLSVLDVDQDGLEDAVVANLGSDAVSVLRRQADGALASSHWGASIDAGGIGAGDLDGDGRFDLVTVEAFGGNASVLWGEGGIRFTAPREYDTGTYPADAIASDLDGDGRLDLVAVGGIASSSVVSLLRGRAGGGFEPERLLEVGSGPYAVATGDLDGDDRPELVTANHDANGITVLRDDGSGAYDSRTDIVTGDRPYHVAVGDLDRDGLRDVVVAHYGSSTIDVLRGVGGGALAPWLTLPADLGPTGVLLEDLDTDGDLDLIAACYESNVVRLYRNDGPAGLPMVATLYHSVVYGPWRVTSTRRPGTDYPFLMVVNRKQYSVATFVVPPGKPAFAYSAGAVLEVGPNPSRVLAMSLDDDNVPDVVVANFNAATLTLARGYGLGFAALATIPAGGWPEALMAGDFTGDGFPDIAVANRHGGTISVFERRPTAGPGVDVPHAAASPGLGAVYPNPASGAVTVRFAVDGAGRARLSIVDLAGRRVRTLAEGSFPAGWHSVAWNGLGGDGAEVAAGIYFCVLEAGERRESRRLLWLR